MNSVGVPSTPLRRPLSTSRSIRAPPAGSAKSASKRSSSRPSLREPAEVVRLEPHLVAEQDVGHLPVAILARRGLGRFGGSLGVGMDLAQGQVAEHEPEPRAGVAQAPDLAHRRRRVGALEVAVHDQLPAAAHSRHVVMGVDRGCQIEGHRRSVYAVA